MWAKVSFLRRLGNERMGKMLKQMRFDEEMNRWRGELFGELDALEAPKLVNSIEEHIAQRPAGIELDCTQLTFVDSMGLGALVKARKKAEALGGYIKLTNVKKRIQKLFVITGLEASFGLEDTQ